jgi:hypothetical protein
VIRRPSMDGQQRPAFPHLVICDDRLIDFDLQSTPFVKPCEGSGNLFRRKTQDKVGRRLSALALGRNLRKAMRCASSWPISFVYSRFQFVDGILQISRHTQSAHPSHPCSPHLPATVHCPSSIVHSSILPPFHLPQGN